MVPVTFKPGIPMHSCTLNEVKKLLWRKPGPRLLASLWTHPLTSLLTGISLRINVCEEGRAQSQKDLQLNRTSVTAQITNLRGPQFPNGNKYHFSAFCLLRTDPVPEAREDAAATINAIETLSEEEQEELRRELAKVEEEIQTLSQVLAAKEKHLAEIKRKLGINSLQELKQNIAKGWQDVTATPVYKRTSETLSQAGQKASAAFASVGSVITKKLEDVKLQVFSHSFSIRSIQHSISMPAMRNSPTFKSFEEKVENLKSKVGGTKPAGGDFGEVLNSTANASATSVEPLPEQTREGL
ncbi:tumor protein D52 isoform X2 [Phyllostomus discolor]|uniref:Tumor protein D52 isoform X2 n=1 Tax=Phyllostomus discolor TaxID=89673 RepID=A0A7E6E6L3_9CHIR|nr:tumor protein D52 isoform X2 [Phyllostomus discolor]